MAWYIYLMMDWLWPSLRFFPEIIYLEWKQDSVTGINGAAEQRDLCGCP